MSFLRFVRRQRLDLLCVSGAFCLAVGAIPPLGLASFFDGIMGGMAVGIILAEWINRRSW